MPPQPFGGKLTTRRPELPLQGVAYDWSRLQPPPFFRFDFGPTA